MVLMLNMPMSSVAAMDNRTVIDLYAENYQETICLEGETFRFNYYYDEMGRRCIEVKNMDTNAVDIVAYDDSINVLYQNGVVIGMETDKENDIPSGVGKRTNDNMWLFLMHTDKEMKIYTAQVSILAAGIAGLIGFFMPAQGVIAAVGAEILSQIVSEYEDIIIGTDTYMYNSTLITQYKYVFAHTPIGGSPYGPYVHITPIL